MRVLYFDCFAGVSGDMIIGALLDLGVDFESLSRQLESLGLTGYQIKVERVMRSGIAATKFAVEVNESAQPERTLPQIVAIIERASLSEQVKRRAARAFQLLADAEALVHGSTVDQIHFHEVGAVDSIIDTVGAMIALEMLGASEFCASALRVGHGFVPSQHGRLPIPAPATAELLLGVSVYAGDIEGEFVTPTGAAVLTSLCEKFGEMPAMRLDRVGYGAGSRNPEGFPNALRLVWGETTERPDAQRLIVEPTSQTLAEGETVVVIETNIDDMNPQAYAFVMERAFALNALDVFLAPVQMKKDRPGVLLTVLAKPDDAEALIDLLLKETTTLGVRYHQAKRRTLGRTVESVATEYGVVRIKVARDGARTLHFQPEYEDCARLAGQARVPFLEVHDAARAAYRERLKSNSGEAESNGELETK
ncbi:MAG TPA: nickel pincer cofactor biosynthesis protein LarC [Blastocatellia bacterium]|nr:nickel pincer cofactor biosynthesis protein LarC [Blastocatellia bacterium]